MTKTLLEIVQALPDISTEDFQFSDRSSIANIIATLLSKAPVEYRQVILDDVSLSVDVYVTTNEDGSASLQA